MFIEMVRHVSYSTVVKNELCEVKNINDCCMVSEICAIVKMIGHWAYDEEILQEILVRTENKLLADIYIQGIKKFYGIDVKKEIIKSANRRRTLYNLSICNKDISLDLIDDLNSVIPQHYNFDVNKSEKCCIKAFLRGAFLSAGSISDPNKTYHLEVSTKDEETAGLLCGFFNDFNIYPKMLLRKDTFVVYIKDAEDISRFLNIIGAHNSLMHYENIRIEKDISNNVNRAVNCETANIQKSLDASFKQIESIKYIIDSKGLSFLPEKLKQLAIRRLENPELNLEDLGKTLNPPLGKSGVSHRMKKIKAIANELKESEED